MNNFQKKFFKNLTEPKWHAIYKDELNCIEKPLISSQVQSAFHYIHFDRQTDALFLKKGVLGVPN